jgi:hypothetical protein
MVPRELFGRLEICCKHCSLLWVYLVIEVEDVPISVQVIDFLVDNVLGLQ